MITDEELNQRLKEVYGFTPCDGFANCRDKLRKGFAIINWPEKGIGRIVYPLPICPKSVTKSGRIEKGQ